MLHTYVISFHPDDTDRGFYEVEFVLNQDIDWSDIVRERVNAQTKALDAYPCMPVRVLKLVGRFKAWESGNIRV